MSDATTPQDATSYHETAAGVIARSALLELEFAGIARGLNFILDHYKTADLTPEFLLQLHQVCFGPIFPEWAGSYRTISVETSTHTFPPFYQVPELIHNFFADLNARLAHAPEPIELIAWAQHRLVWIHPFQDYNGRTARLFSNLLMLRLGLPLAEVPSSSGAERKTYIDAMKAADGGDYRPLETLLSQAVAEAASER